MPTIMSLKARQLFDSRGIPTIEAEIRLDNGGHASFITPSGASCGSKEALELRDNNPHEFAGKGVQKALGHIRTIINEALLHKEFNNQEELDNLLIDLDGTSNKKRLGANALLAVSGAFFRASAHGLRRPLYEIFIHNRPFILPMPLVNIINGGAHANNNLDIQEFMLVPIGASRFDQSLRFCAEVFYVLKELIAKKNLSTAVGDEGGFAPLLRCNEEALDFLCEAVLKAGFKLGKDIAFALDVAATEIFNKEKNIYIIQKEELALDDMISWYKNLTTNYPICSLEDPFAEDDFEAFALITKILGEHIQIVGDDLFVTNINYIKNGIENSYANAVLIKMNQVGTISETLSAVELTQKAGLKAIISHRSGESEDTTIADLAVLTRAGQIKTGSMSRSERLAKYNQLLRIEEELGAKALFSKPTFGYKK
jgi:enolase